MRIKAERKDCRKNCIALRNCINKNWKFRTNISHPKRSEQKETYPKEVVAEFVIWTNTFCNLDKYIQQSGQINLAIWTNTFNNLDKQQRRKNMQRGSKWMAKHPFASDVYSSVRISDFMISNICASKFSTSFKMGLWFTFHPLFHTLKHIESFLCYLSVSAIENQENFAAVYSVCIFCMYILYIQYV